MSIPIKLEVFEGPLDFLLHLIDKNKVDIYDIPIVIITEQYLEYVRTMPSQDMNVMSEFMVMAATLIDIKCRMLLPKETNEEGVEEDPRAELVQKLLEYKMFKFVSMQLREKQINAQRNLYKAPTVPQEILAYRPPIDYDTLLGTLTLSKLRLIFSFVLKKQEDKTDPIRSKYGNVEKEEVDMDAKMLFVEAYAKSHESFDFRSLLEGQATKMQMIVTFLVILELMKVGAITIFQDQNSEELTIKSHIHTDQGVESLASE
ncbi:MAG: segregation/condensation protein A [Lachnospiraceae bacterium]|jgi:segregation and condensation protein A|nr:segregation/condensation protein A [Lachnospiraceae bacterium]